MIFPFSQNLRTTILSLKIPKNSPRRGIAVAGFWIPNQNPESLVGESQIQDNHVLRHCSGTSRQRPHQQQSPPRSGGGGRRSKKRRFRPHSRRNSGALSAALRCSSPCCYKAGPFSVSPYSFNLDSLKSSLLSSSQLLRSLLFLSLISSLTRFFLFLGPAYTPPKGVKNHEDFIKKNGLKSCTCIDDVYTKTE